MDRDSLLETAAPSGWTRVIPVWLISLAVHLGVLILGALLVTAERPAAGIGDADRPVSVVLAQRTAERTDYFAEQDAAAAAVLPSALAAASGAASAGSISGPTGPPPLLPGITLPQLPGAIAPREGLVGVATSGAPGKLARILPELGDAEILAADAAIPREVLPTGPTAQLGLFGAPAATGRSFVFVIDRSASMGGSGLGAIQAAAGELKTHLSQLSDQQTFQVVAYNQSSIYFTEGGLVPASADNQRQLVKFVEDIAAYGQTEHTRGLLAALRLKPEVIFLLTDAGDPVMKPADLRLIREVTRGRTSIHCLHFGRGQLDSAENFMQRLATENRGSYTYIDMNAR
jgi:Ca-activated chloride channel family protein